MIPAIPHIRLPILRASDLAPGAKALPLPPLRTRVLALRPSLRRWNGPGAINFPIGQTTACRTAPDSIPSWISPPGSPSDLSRPAAKIGDSARISHRLRHLCSHKLLKLMKILTRTPIPSLRRSKSDGLLEFRQEAQVAFVVLPPTRRPGVSSANPRSAHSSRSSRSNPNHSSTSCRSIVLTTSSAVSHPFLARRTPNQRYSN